MCLKNGPYNIASLCWLNVQFHMIGATFFSIQVEFAHKLVVIGLGSDNFSLLLMYWHEIL